MTFATEKNVPDNFEKGVKKSIRDWKEVRNVFGKKSRFVANPTFW